jgi:hypothetical protein
MNETKPEWVRKIHVAAHQGHQITDCSLCAALLERERLDQAIIDAANEVARKLRNLGKPEE